MSKCLKCGSELKEGQKFCMKCGTPVSTNPQQPAAKQMTAAVCSKCGNPLKPGQKFCMKCGTPVASAPRQTQSNDKGWFTDGVRAVANAVTGGALNRDIAREQQQAVRQQERADQGIIEEAQQGLQAAERAQLNAEREAEQARNRRNQEAIDGVDVVRGRAIWSIQPGQIARKISERELEEIEKLKGVIVQEGCQAIIFANGELVATLSAGAYQFFKSVEEEKAAIKAAIEKAEKELDEKERKAREQRRQQEPTFRELGVVGEIGRAGRWVGRLIFGEKKDEKKEKIELRVKKAQQRIENLQMKKTFKNETKTFSIGTARNNYSSPKIAVSWCKDHDVPINKIYSKSLAEKFDWAMDTPADYWKKFPNVK